jgi:hypothetical protein
MLLLTYVDGARHEEALIMSRHVNGSSSVATGGLAVCSD